MNALSLMQWLVSWEHCLIFETRLWRTLVDGPAADNTILQRETMPPAQGAARTLTNPSRGLHHIPGMVPALSNNKIQFVVPQSIV